MGKVPLRASKVPQRHDDLSYSKRLEKQDLYAEEKSRLRECLGEVCQVWNATATIALKEISPTRLFELVSNATMRHKPELEHNQLD